MRIVAISVSDRKGVRKDNVRQALLRPDHGVERDAHAGPGIRQVSLLARESIDKMVELGLEVAPGDFAENITTEGIELAGLPLGQKIKLGEEALVEVSQIGKECHDRCAIFHQAGDCVMPKEGIFVRVLKKGTIRVNDPITLLAGEGLDAD
ncbi:MAG: MOSC domain-containing protein [bacterium]|nr:MAG: MOSC domain-containing protein [bacterium]